MMSRVATAPALTDTAIPGLTRRRVWSAPSVVSHSLLALTFQKLYLAPAGASVRADTAKSLECGGDLAAVFGPLGTVVDLSTVTRVRFDLLANSLTLEYPQTREPGTMRLRGGPARVVIAFADHESADDLYTKLWRRLGDRVELRPYRREFWESGRTPVALMIGVVMATAMLAVAANAAADTDTGAPLPPGFDWRWVCGVGGAVLALLQVRLYRSCVQPPTHLELAARHPATRT